MNEEQTAERTDPARIGRVLRDDEFARAILVRAILGVTVASVGGLLLRIAMGARPDAGTVIGGVVLSLCGVSWWLVQRGSLRAGTWLFLAVSWLMVAAISLARGPAYPATLPLYLLLVLLTGLLLSTRAAVGLAIVSAVAGVGITYVHEHHLLPTPEPIGVAYRAISGVVAFLVVVLTFVAALRRLRAALEELEQKNLELERNRQNLEGIVAARTRSLVDARMAAEAASRAKSVFLANMSHELRTPLNAVLGMTDVLIATPLPDEQRDRVRTIREGGDALLAVLNDVLDLGAVEAGRLSVERAPFEPRGVVDDVVKLMQPEAARAGNALTVHVGDGVPERVVGDGRRVRQVLFNLVGNAVKFTERGRVEVRVAAGHRLAFTVVDTGIGIAPGDLQRIFEPFTQLDASPTRRRGGAGLGLAISRELATLMSGTLRVESTPGRGSSFTLDLPLVVDTSAKPEPVAARPAVPGGLRILIAEDNDVNVRVLKHMLRHLGLDADVVGTGAAALAAVTASPYDCVLMDVHMPEMDGLEATRRIRAAKNGDAPVIVAVTADALPEQRAAVREAGVDEVLTKPLVLESLAAALSRVAERRPKSGEPA